jgi:hypothetical protein
MAGSDMIAEHELFGMRLEVQLADKVLDLMHTDVMPEERNGHDQRNEFSSVVVDR